MHILIFILLPRHSLIARAATVSTQPPRGSSRIFFFFFFSPGQVFGSILKSPVTNDTRPSGVVTFSTCVRSCLSESGWAGVTPPPFPFSP